MMQEIIKAVEQLNEDGVYIVLQTANALIRNGCKKEPTGYFHGVEKKENILYPVWGDKKEVTPMTNATPLVQENQSKPEPKSESKPEPEPKEPIVVEVMPWEAMPEGYTDYRPFLQRDGLILLGWEMRREDIEIVWCSANGNMNRYQVLVDADIDFSTVRPKRRYEDWRHWLHRGKTPDQIVYTAPPDLTALTRTAFIAKLRASGVSVDFDYQFTLGKQKAEAEKALLDRIESPGNTLLFEETKLLEAYRQLDQENKTAFIEHMKALQVG